MSGRKPQRHGKLEYEGSLNVCMDSTFGRLTENDTRQNVVQLNVQKSHLFVSLRSLTLNNLVASFAHIGHINIDVPLRPMIVHGVVYRESKVIEQKILPEIKNFGIFEEEKAGGSTSNATVASGATGTGQAAGTSTQTVGGTGTISAPITTTLLGNAGPSEGLVGRDRTDMTGNKQIPTGGAIKKPILINARVEVIDENETIYSG